MTERLVVVKEGEPWTPFLQQVNHLFIEEKKARSEADANKISQICCQIIKFCFESNEMDRLREFLLSLSKKRSQSKKAITDYIRTGIELLEKMPEQEKMKTLETLREITEGKLFLEVEYARCSRMFAQILIDKNLFAKAADTIQEVQVETYGSMEKREKFEYILFQILVMLLKKDYVRTFIVAKKVDSQMINDNNLDDLKIKYHQLMIQYYLNERNLFEIAQANKVIYDTIVNAPDKFKDKNLRDVSFENMIFFSIASTYTLEKIEYLNNINLKYYKVLKLYPLVKKYFEDYISLELMNFNPSQMIKELDKIKMLKMENSDYHFECLQKEIIRRNVRIIDKYYSRIKLDRLAELLNINPERCEEEISYMVNNKLIHAKICRIDRIVYFREQKSPSDYLNSWSADIKALCELTEETCHLINREEVLSNK